jgi:hypothetical protein
MVASIDIYNHPDWFYCRTLRSWMRKAVCVRYQQMAARAAEADNGYAGGTGNIAFDRRLSCLDCEQGREIAKGGMDMEEVKRQPGRPKKDRTKPKLKYPCRDCGVREAVDKNGKPLIHGRCNVCHKLAIDRANKRKAGVITLNFAGYEGALDALKKRAKAQFRGLEQQIMWDLIHMAAEKGGTS